MVPGTGVGKLGLKIDKLALSLLLVELFALTRPLVCDIIADRPVCQLTH